MARRYCPPATARELAKDLGVSTPFLQSLISGRGIGTVNDDGVRVLSRDDQRFLAGIMESTGRTELAKKLLTRVGK